MASGQFYGMDDEISSKEKERFPHTYKLRQAVQGLWAQADMLRDVVLGWSDPDMSGLSDELESLYNQVASLKEELGFLKEMKAQEVLDSFRTTVLELRQVLRAAPYLESVHNPEALDGFRSVYEPWHMRSRLLALNTCLISLRSEIERAQRLTKYTLREERYIDYESETFTSDWNRIPYVVPNHPWILYDRYGISTTTCPSCGVEVGQFHLINSKDQPACDLEECPVCPGRALTCGHNFCAKAEEEPVVAASDDNNTNDLFSGDDIPF